MKVTITLDDGQEWVTLTPNPETNAGSFACWNDWLDDDGTPVGLVEVFTEAIKEEDEQEIREFKSV